MAKQRCSKHPFYYEPCSVCAEIRMHKERIRNLEEQGLFQYKLRTELENDFKNLVERQRAEIKTLTDDYCIAEEANDAYRDKICELKEEVEDLSVALEKALNSANKSYNPEAKLKLSSHDLIVVRGVFVANAFIYNSLVNMDNCIQSKKDESTKEQLTLIKNDLEKEWNRIVELLKTFAKEFSDSNWNRMIKETQKIVDLAVNTMNDRSLGSFTLSKSDESISAEYKVRPGVMAAVSKALASSGTNSLTTYSKELLIQEIIKLMEEK